jgi:hypothetical protein
MVEGQTGRQTLLLRRDAPARHALVLQPVNAVRARRAAALIGLPVWIGLAAQELRTDRLRDHDPNVPLVVCARPAKPG